MNSLIKKGWPMGLALMTLAAPLALAQDGAQECRQTLPVSAPDTRYIDNLDGTVTDKVTGLIWKQCPEGLSGADCGAGSEDVIAHGQVPEDSTLLTWQAALQHAAAADFAGSHDWRLPNLKELQSLVELGCRTPAVNSRLFPNTPGAAASEFWTSSAHPSQATDAYAVDFSEGYITLAPKELTAYVRLVRDAD